MIICKDIDSALDIIVFNLFNNPTVLKGLTPYNIDVGIEHIIIDKHISEKNAIRLREGILEIMQGKNIVIK